jgi:membrane protease YdiL (CAAX protease family)
MRSTSTRNFLDLARLGPNQWWRYALTLAWGIATSIALTGGLTIGLALATGRLPEDLLQVHEDPIDQNLSLVILLASLVFVLPGLWAGVRLLHRRRLRTLVTPAPRVDLGKIFFAGGLWALLMAASVFVSIALSPETVSVQFHPRPFAVLVAILVTLMPLQALLEELIFRGYLMQGFGLVSRTPLTPLVVTSALFALLHGSNPEVAAFGWMVMLPQYFAIGLLLGVVTLLDGGMEIAIGVHAANNMTIALLVTSPHVVFQTPALFRVEELHPGIDFLLWLAAAAIFLWVTNRKYRWGDWRRLLR